MASEKLKVGIIGMGKMGRIRADVVKRHPLLELKCIYDIDETASAGLDVKRYKKPDELIRQELDIIFICTYNNVAAEYTIAALESGKHVFCEKPPAMSVRELEKVIEVEKQNPGLFLKYGLNHRYHYSVMEAKKIIDSNKFGKILWMRGVYGKAGGVDYEKNWRSDVSKAGGGILLDQGIHMLDLFEYLCGGFSALQSCITTSYWNIPVEDNAFVVLKNKANQVAFFHSSSNQWKHKFSLEIALEDGYVNLNGILSSTKSYGDETLTFAKKQFEDTATAIGRPREEMIYFDRDDSWRLEIEEFVDSLTGKDKVLMGTTSDALTLMKLIEDIYKNARK